MSWAPLFVRDVPVAGPDGRRRNVTELFRAIATAVPPGRAVRMDVVHDTGCPRQHDRAVLGGAMDGCTCRTVDVTLSLIDPRAS